MTKTKHSVPAACSDPGPLNTLLQQFEKHLKTLGYSPHQTLRVNLSAVSHFVCWLNKAGIDLSEVTETVIEQFACHQCQSTARWWHGGPERKISGTHSSIPSFRGRWQNRPLRRSTLAARG